MARLLRCSLPKQLGERKKRKAAHPNIAHPCARRGSKADNLQMRDGAGLLRGSPLILLLCASNIIPTCSSRQLCVERKRWHTRCDDNGGHQSMTFRCQCETKRGTHNTMLHYCQTGRRIVLGNHESAAQAVNHGCQRHVDYPPPADLCRARSQSIAKKQRPGSAPLSAHSRPQSRTNNLP